MKNYVRSSEDNYEEINRILASLVKQLNQTLRVSLTITASPEWIQQLHEEYVRIAPELDIHNCSNFLILKINEYVLKEASKQLKNSHKEELLDSELGTTQWQIQTLLEMAKLNSR